MDKVLLVVIPEGFSVTPIYSETSAISHKEFGVICLAKGPVSHRALYWGEIARFKDWVGP